MCASHCVSSTTSNRRHLLGLYYNERWISANKENSITRSLPQCHLGANWVSNRPEHAHQWNWPTSIVTKKTYENMENVILADGIVIISVWPFPLTPSNVAKEEESCCELLLNNLSHNYCNCHPKEVCNRLMILWIFSYNTRQRMKGQIMVRMYLQVMPRCQLKLVWMLYWCNRSLPITVRVVNISREKRRNHFRNASQGLLLELIIMGWEKNSRCKIIGAEYLYA